jgi:hypothetical protein
VPDNWSRKNAADPSAFSVELPGIEPVSLPGDLRSDLQFRFISFQFSTSHYLRFRSRVLTASRAVTYRIDLSSCPVELARGVGGMVRQPTATSCRCRCSAAAPTIRCAVR